MDGITLRDREKNVSARAAVGVQHLNEIDCARATVPKCGTVARAIAGHIEKSRQLLLLLLLLSRVSIIHG
jgi:hypothetical protein